MGPLLKQHSNFPLDKNIPTATIISKETDTNSNFIQFPGTNVTLSSFMDTTSNIFTIEIGHILGTTTTNDDDDDDDANEQTHGNLLKRHVVRRIFRSLYDTEVRSFIETS
jgi:hypothetical protein